MRLLNAGTLELREFADSGTPPYAILWHTWEDGEVSLQDLTNGRFADKKGYSKIKACCSVAKQRGLDHVWIDTCCIDKTSSAELSEAINSMYRWYQDAAICLAYLADVPSRAPFAESRWFTRGWTLQELIAPSSLAFFDENWKVLGTKEELEQAVSKRTRIPTSLLLGEGNLDTFSIAQKMSWAAGRKTTRVEDRAYSLLGIFGISMPLIYGEKETAFIRLQEEIMKISDDHSLFAWRSSDTRGGLLAASPDAFADSGNVVEYTPPGTLGSNPLTVSGRGVHLELPFIGISSRGIGLAVLRCKEKGAYDQSIAIYLRDTLLTMNQFERVRGQEFRRISLTSFRLSQRPLRRICVRKGRMTRAEALGHHGNDDESVVDETLSTEAYGSRDKRRVALLQAVTRGSGGDVWLLLSQSDFQNDLKHDYGPEMLSRAVGRGSEPVIKVLLARSEIDADVSDQGGRTLLSRSAEVGHMAALGPLLESGKAEVDSEDNDGRTPLSWAAENGHADAIRLLIVQGANIESKGASGRTPLSHAAAGGHAAAVRLLMKHGANAESEDAWGRTPLSYAAAGGHVSAARVLIEHGANPESKDAAGRTVLSYAIGGGHEAIILLLLSAFSALASRNTHSYSAIYGFWKEGFEAAVALLLEIGTDLDIKDRNGAPLLSWAAGNGLIRIVQLLLEKGASTSTRDNTGRTALSEAALAGSVAVVRLLLEREADIETKDEDGRTPLWLAAWYGHEMVVKLLLERGANIETKDNRGLTPLSSASWAGHWVVARLLLERGADIETKDEDGRTPLWLAAWYGHEMVVKLLLERGANIETEDVGGLTPLWLAAQSGHKMVVRLLETRANIEE